MKIGFPQSGSWKNFFVNSRVPDCQIGRAPSRVDRSCRPLLHLPGNSSVGVRNGKQRPGTGTATRAMVSHLTVEYSRVTVGETKEGP
jgi:hypothetical protein